MKKTFKKGDMAILVEIDDKGFVVPNSIMEIEYPNVSDKFRKVPVKKGTKKAITVNDQFEAILAFRNLSEVFNRFKIGDKIKMYREKLNMSQQELADKTGLKRENIARIESGKYSTGQDILSKIATALGKNLDII
jgi:DNA-binding XRE family transcriptional regulator